MDWCSINLAKDLICPPKRRLILHWSMIGYLVVAGILLLLSIVFASANVKNGMQFHRLTNEIQDRFSSAYPNEKSMKECAENLKRELKKDTAETLSINQALPPRIQTMLPLMISLVQQPDRSQIYNLSFAQRPKGKSPSLEFSLYLPLENKSSPAFLNNWQKNRQLTDVFADINPVTTRLGWINNSRVSIMSYRVNFKE